MAHLESQIHSLAQPRRTNAKDTPLQQRQWPGGSTPRSHTFAQSDMDGIIADTLSQVLPEPAVKAALQGKVFPGRVIMVAIGKAAWRMAQAAQQTLGPSLSKGIVITKYSHIEGPLENIRCWEAGHPLPDANSYAATAEALSLTASLYPTDTVLFLVSGGGSALFEQPAVPTSTLESINKTLLKKGASIEQINAIRKRLSRVKAGRFAKHCAPAKVFQVVLSDVVGNHLDVIASGPAAPDTTTIQKATALLQAYDIALAPDEQQVFAQETPKQLDNVETVIAGGVSTLCQAAATACQARGYLPTILSTTMEGEAKQEGANLARLAMATQHQTPGKIALIIGGETTVHVTGTGLGGRNQEFALAAAQILEGSSGIALFSLGSDGTDGPTDAAGGFVDGTTWQAIAKAGIDPARALANNDSYRALDAAGNLLITGPTGTNVNDVAIALIHYTGAQCI